MEARHRPWYVAAVVCACVTLSVNTTLTFIKLLSSPQTAHGGTLMEVYRNYSGTTEGWGESEFPPTVHFSSLLENDAEAGDPLEPPRPAEPPSATIPLLPASPGWVFIILVLVYSWQVLWVVYGLTTLCRKTSYGFLYVAPGYMHPSVYWCFSATNLCSVATIVMVKFDLKVVALATTLVAMVSVYVAVFMSLRRVYIRAPVLIREKKKAEIWLARLFVHNGLASLSTWLTYVALFHMAFVLTQVFGVDREISVTIAVNIIFIEAIVWFFLDNFTWDKFTRYTVSPYIISILTLVSILSTSEFSDLSSSNSVMITFMLGVNGLCLVLKCAVAVFRHVRQPLFTEVGFSATSKNYGTLDYSHLRPDSEHRTLI